MAAEPAPREPLVERFPALARLGRRRGRIPTVRQLAAADCGAACLAMVLGYHGRTVPTSELREALGAVRDGVSARTLLDVARRYGLRGRGVSLDIDQLKYLDPASVLHWEFSHFVVFEGLAPDGVHVVDPATGPRRVGADELRRAFTGVALLFEPDERFQPEAGGGSRALHHARQVLAQTGYLPRVIVLSLLLQAIALAVPVATSLVVDRVVPRGDWHLLHVLGAAVVGLLGFQFVSTLVRAHMMLHVRTLVDVRMTLGFLDHLVSLPYAFFQLRSAGDLLARVNSNTVIREIVTGGVMSLVVDGTLACLYMALLIVANGSLSLLVAALAAAQVAVFLASRSRVRELMAQSLASQAHASNRLVEIVAGIETLKVVGAERQAVARYSDALVDLLNVALESGRLGALLGAVNATLRLLSPVALLGFGTVQVLRGELSLGAMLGLNALAAGFLGPLGSLVGTAGQLQLVASYVERLDDVIQCAPEQSPDRARQAPRLGGRIELDAVSFRYGPLAPMVVRDVSVAIAPGQFVAIVGRSGSGKSTLAGLLVGLHAPVAGRILYDGVDLGQMDLHALRRQVGMVPQRAYLFGTTVRANVALADPDLPLERVQAAARTACVEEDILAMPLGYDTPVLDGGASLAGGQRQRIALARALVSAPAILVLDEATSALDAVTEARVQAALAALRCTRIVIAHRLSTVAAADLILVMDGGRVVESGRHEALLAAGGAYARLVAAQLTGSGG